MKLPCLAADLAAGAADFFIEPVASSEGLSDEFWHVGAPQ
jgi:hypothetical protein